MAANSHNEVKNVYNSLKNGEYDTNIQSLPLILIVLNILRLMVVLLTFTNLKVILNYEGQTYFFLFVLFQLCKVYHIFEEIFLIYLIIKLLC